MFYKIGPCCRTSDGKCLKSNKNGGKDYLPFTSGPHKLKTWTDTSTGVSFSFYTYPTAPLLPISRVWLLFCVHPAGAEAPASAAMTCRLAFGQLVFTSATFRYVVFYFCFHEESLNPVFSVRVVALALIEIFVSLVRPDLYGWTYVGRDLYCKTVFSAVTYTPQISMHFLRLHGVQYIFFICKRYW